MATALPINPDLECCICFQPFKTPKILSCGHSFCLNCLVSCINGSEGTFPCPFCKQDVVIPQGGADKLITNFSLKTLIDSTSLKPKHYCPNHSQKEVDYYCQTCSFGLCSKCIYRDHKDHETLDLELDSTREIVVPNLSKSEQFLKNNIEDLEKTHAALLETSEQLKSFCDEACTKLSEKTKKIIDELKENCEKIQNEFQDTFDKNELKLTETRQKVMTQITNIKTDLDKSRPTTEKPTLTLIYSVKNLRDLQKLCENMKIDIPPVTYVEWREGNVKVCDILGSTVTKPLYQSRDGSGPISTVTKPLYQSSEGSGPTLTVSKLYQYMKGNVFKFNYKDIEKEDVKYYSKNKYKTRGKVWSCCVLRHSYDRCLDIDIELLEEDNKRVWSNEIKYTLTIMNKDIDKNVSKIETKKFLTGISGGTIEIQLNRLTDSSEGFIDNEGQFLVRLDILQVLDTEYDSD